MLKILRFTAVSLLVLLLTSTFLFSQSYSLPVVFHVITDGTTTTTTSPSDAQIDAALLFMNQSFNKIGACGVATGITFVKAARTPAGTATTGITRTDGSGVANYTTNGINNGISAVTAATQGAIMNLDRWDASSYINIWIVNKIEGYSTYTDNVPATGGYASPRNGSGYTNDGVVVLASQMTSPSSPLIKTLATYLGLWATDLGGCEGYDSNRLCSPTETSCMITGDMICDTEDYSVDPGVAPNCSNITTVTNSRTGVPFIVDANGCSVLNNYMSKSPATCRSMFTSEQAGHMKGSIDKYRPGLTNSAGDTPPTTCPTSACAYTNTNGLSKNRVNLGLQFFRLGTRTADHIEVRNTGPSGFEGSNYIDHACTQSATFVAGSSQTFGIDSPSPASSQLTTPSSPLKFWVYIDYNNNGTFDEPAELVYTAPIDAAAPLGGTIIFPATAVKNTPLRVRVIGDLSVASGGCVGTGNATDGGGQAEDFSIILADPLPVDLLYFKASPQGDRTVKIDWETATEENSAYFVVERSDNLKTFENVAKVQSGGNSSERRTYNAIDNNPTSGINYYRLKEFATSGTPRIYAPVAVNVDADNAGTIIYPNPNNGTFIVSLPSNVSETATFKLSTILGTDILLQSEKAGNRQFKLKATSKLAIGVYMLTVQTDGAVRNLKVIVQE